MAFPSEVINTENHPFVGIVWPVTGSKGDEYSVEMTDQGFECDCPAYRKCKHIKSCLLYTSPSPRDVSSSRMPSSA